MVADLNGILSQLSQANRQGTNSIYGSVGQAINSVPLGFTADSNPWAIFAGNLAKNLLGTGVTAYGQSSANAYDQAARAALSNDYFGTNMPVSDRLGDSDLAQISQLAQMSKLQDAATRQSTFADAMAKAQADAQGKVLGENAAYAGLGGDASLLSPLKQAEIKNQDRGLDYLGKSQDYLLKDPTSVAYTQMNQGVQTLIDELGKNTKYADLITNATTAKLLDSIGAVNEGAVKTVESSTPYLTQALGGIKGAITGEGTLTPEAKLALISAVTGKYDPIGQQYNQILHNQQANLDFVSPGLSAKLAAQPYKPLDMAPLYQKYGVAPPSAPVVVTPGAAPSAAAITGGGGGDMQAQYNALRAQGMSPEQAKAALK